MKAVRRRPKKDTSERPASRDEARRLWHEFAAKRGLNASKARDAVVEVFFGMKDHASLQELYAAARKRHEGVGFATVYRTMKLLDEAGLAASRNFGEGKATLYEVAAGRAHHDHLICESCGRIVEFVDDDVETFQERIAKRYGFTLMRHRHELYGLCPDCQRRRGV